MLAAKPNRLNGKLCGRNLLRCRDRFGFDSDNPDRAPEDLFVNRIGQIVGAAKKKRKGIEREL